MKRLHNYIILSVLAIAFASCSEDEVIDNNGQNHVAGDILFGLSLPEASSRTVYGDEDKVNNAFPIYWVNGDKVQIFSPQALEGRRNAEYQVSVDKPKNFADNLTKTGDYGVQWGTGYTVDGNPGYHDFYSLYPSGNYTLSTDGTKAENITINSMQNVVVNDGVVKSDMEDCLMYAKTTGVKKGETVNLQYNPITTALMITVKVAENQTGTDPDNFTIQSVKLEADAEIAGTFSLNVQNGTFGGFVDGKSSKTIQADIVSPSTGGYHVIKNGESFTIPLFLAPTDKTLNVQKWKISVVANNNAYTKTLNINKTLEPGQIHKIVLPELAPAATDWDITKWMTYIPRNVYLSEVSIPGSWNSLNPDFQSETSISKQYANGVRAFHLDARWKADYNGWGVSTSEDKFSNFELSVANGGGTREVGTVLGIGTAPRVMKSDAPTFVSCLSEITTKIQPDEYMVLFCSFAQDSYNNVDYIGNTWLQAISDACKDNEVIYDGSSINPNTLVGDVLGHVIVIVNCENEISKETLPENSKCLFCHIPNHLTGDYFPASGFKSDNLHSSSSSTAAISMAVSQAQITSSTGSAISDGVRGYYPSFDERTRVVNAILDWSKNNYGTANYAHDKWVYLGLGGNTASSKSSTGDNGTASNVATTYSKLLNDRIASMGNNGVSYYPIGIVYLNNATSNPSVETVKNVLLLNNKYRLQYDETKPSDYKPNDGQGGEGGDAI